MNTKKFLVTLRTPIKVQQLRADKSPMILKTVTLIVEWPLVADSTVESGESTVEGPLVDLRVVAFATDGESGDGRWWESPFLKSGCEPFELQLKRENILSRQAV